MDMELTNGEIESFARDGAVPLYGLLNDWIETLRAGIARNMAEPSPDAKIYTGQGRALLRRLLQLGAHRRIPGFHLQFAGRRNRPYTDEIARRPPVPRACAGQGGRRRCRHAMASGPANTSPSRQRRAFSLRLIGDDVRFARRAGVVTSPPFRDVQLARGAVMDAPEFPLLSTG